LKIFQIYVNQKEKNRLINDVGCRYYYCFQS